MKKDCAVVICLLICGAALVYGATLLGLLAGFTTPDLIVAIAGFGMLIFSAVIFLMGNSIRNSKTTEGKR